MMKTWILVADRARARLFYAASDSAELQEIGTWADPEGRALGHDLETERLQTTYESVGEARHSIEPHTRSSRRPPTASRIASARCSNTVASNAPTTSWCWSRSRISSAR